MNYFNNLSTEKAFKLHIGWRIIGILLYYFSFPSDVASLLGQGLGIILATIVLIKYENNIIKWLWYISTAFSTAVFTLYVISEKIPYFYIVTLPVFLTQLATVYKIYQKDKYEN